MQKTLYLKVKPEHLEIYIRGSYQETPGKEFDLLDLLATNRLKEKGLKVVRIQVNQRNILHQTSKDGSENIWDLQGDHTEWRRSYERLKAWRRVAKGLLDSKDYMSLYGVFNPERPPEVKATELVFICKEYTEN